MPTMLSILDIIFFILNMLAYDDICSIGKMITQHHLRPLVWCNEVFAINYALLIMVQKKSITLIIFIYSRNKVLKNIFQHSLSFRKLPTDADGLCSVPLVIGTRLSFKPLNAVDNVLKLIFIYSNIIRLHPPHLNMIFIRRNYLHVIGVYWGFCLTQEFTTIFV